MQSSRHNTAGNVYEAMGSPLPDFQFVRQQLRELKDFRSGEYHEGNEAIPEGVQRAASALERVLDEPQLVLSEIDDHIPDGEPNTSDQRELVLNKGLAQALWQQDVSVQNVVWMFTNPTAFRRLLYSSNRRGARTEGPDPRTLSVAESDFASTQPEHSHGEAVTIRPSLSAPEADVPKTSRQLNAAGFTWSHVLNIVLLVGLMLSLSGSRGFGPKGPDLVPTHESPLFSGASAEDIERLRGAEVHDVVPLTLRCESKRLRQLGEQLEDYPELLLKVIRLEIAWNSEY